MFPPSKLYNDGGEQGEKVPKQQNMNFCGTSAKVAGRNINGQSDVVHMQMKW